MGGESKIQITYMVENYCSHGPLQNHAHAKTSESFISVAASNQKPFTGDSESRIYF